MKKVLLYIILFFNVSVLAQQIKITGRVIDEHTEEAMAFASVYFEGTQIGTTTDFDGNFELITKRTVDTLTVTVIGYKKVKKYVSNEPSQNINFRLPREEAVLDEVVVVAGENPANILLKKVIENKEKNDPNRLQYLKQEAYTKMELDIDNINSKMKENKLMKPFAFIFENIDSVSEEKPYLPMFITESLSDIAFSKIENKKREVIKATKVSGVKNESVTQFLGSMYQNINIYDNWMPILGKSFPSPISSQGLFYYKYYLVDSQTIDKQWCYKLKFKPRRTTEPTFYGEFWVVDTLYAIQQISMMLSKDANVNFVDKLSVFQQYIKSEDNKFMLAKDKLIIDFISPKNSAGVLGRRTSYYKNFETDQEYVKAFLIQKDDIIVNEDAYEKNDTFWNNARHEKLSINETKIYKMVDSIKNVPVFKTYVDVVTTIVSGYYEIGPIELGPYFKMWSNNDYDGDRFRIGFRTSQKFFNRGWIEPYVAYGLHHKKWYGGVAGKILITRKPWQFVGFNANKDINVQSTSAEELGSDNILSGLYRRQDIKQRLMMINDYKVYYQRDLPFGVQINAGVNYRFYDPLFHEIIEPLDFKYYLQDEIKPQTTISTSELNFKLRYAYKEKFIVDKRTRVSLGSKYPIFDISVAIAKKGIINSQFDYVKMELKAYDNFRINAIGWSEYYASIGKVWGTLPYILLEVHPGNQTFFYNTFAFNMMNMHEFASDTYTTLLWTHHFEGLFLDQTPLLRKLKLRWCASGKIAWGNMSKANIEYNKYNYAAVFRNNENNVVRIPVRAPFGRPYTEVSVGLENIFKLIRIDAIWRINYLDNKEANRLGIRAGMRLTF